MLQFVSVLFFGLLSSQIWAAKEFTKNDLTGPDSICSTLKEASDCPATAGALTNTSDALDDYLAMTELRRNIELMAGAQVQSSLQLLQIMGMQRPGMLLNRQLERLKINGIDHELTAPPQNPELSEKYIVAAIRYHELKTLSASNKFGSKLTSQIHKKIKLLELRYPLISNHHFKSYKDSLCATLKMSCRPQEEATDEESILDEFLFNEQPRELTQIKLNKDVTYSVAGKMALFLAANTDQALKKSLSAGLVSELEESFSNQLTPLTNLKSIEECNLLNLHSKLTLQVINSSANPQRMFGKYCSCQTTKKIINENLVMGLEMASLGGLGLCLTPSGVGQVLGCPTAAIAGLAATGANGINFINSVDQFKNINDQKNIVKFLDRTNINKAEEEYLKNKEYKAMKEAGIAGLAGLIGFGIGNIGMKGLIKYFHQGNVSGSVKHLTQAENAILDKAMAELDLKDQTKAFVLLEKLDGESRNILIKNPTLFVKEIKKGGKSCDL